MIRIRYSIFVVIIVSCVVSPAFSVSTKGGWVPIEERRRTWDAVLADQLPAGDQRLNPKLYKEDESGFEATFEKDGAKWSIMGANAPIVDPTRYPNNWPVKGKAYEVLIVTQPVSDYRILPFMEKLDNTDKLDTLSVTAARDSYEPLSFVIRTGEVGLKDVSIEASDLKTLTMDENGKKKTATIPKEYIDIRSVKCWYQAGESLFDTRHKMLMPELLLHDDSLVRVDHERQVNIIRNLESLRDAEKFIPLEIGKRQNKQIWLTLYVDKETIPGRYTGKIVIKPKDSLIKELDLSVEVLSVLLPQPMLDYALYYRGALSDGKTPEVGANRETHEQRKTYAQMLQELRDMKAHGLTNATVEHRVGLNPAERDKDWARLRRTLQLRKEAGWGERPLLYLDWKTTLKEDLPAYKKKIETIVSVAREFGKEEVYIYGVDEAKGKDLIKLAPAYQAVHQAGARNFVSTTPEFLDLAPGLIDLPVLFGEQSDSFMAKLKRLDIRAWRYGKPQAGREKPEMNRYDYGIRLLRNGFSGACNFLYQDAYWNDFKNSKIRMHTMAYPTVDRPIPTLQWEGWRAGVNDIRYLTLLKNKGLLDDQWLERACYPILSRCREEAVRRLSLPKSL